jgi:hypothetical protein
MLVNFRGIEDGELGVVSMALEGSTGCTKLEVVAYMRSIKSPTQ